MEHKKQCENCGKKYKSKTKRSRFCSDYCRVDWNRKKAREEKSKPKTPPKKGKLVFKGKGDKKKVVFKPTRNGKIQMHDSTTAAKYDQLSYGVDKFVADVDNVPLIDAAIKANNAMQNAIASQPPATKVITYADLLSLAKTGKITKEEVSANKNLNSNQKSMLYAKIKKT